MDSYHDSTHKNILLDASPSSSSSFQVVVLYATQTGTAQDVADRIALFLRKRAVQVQVHSLADLRITDLIDLKHTEEPPQAFQNGNGNGNIMGYTRLGNRHDDPHPESPPPPPPRDSTYLCDPARDPNTKIRRLFVFVVATSGEGVLPDSARPFWRQLLQKKWAPQSTLAHIHFAMLGLGDSSYLKFNAAARKLDKRLRDLGAKWVPRGEEGSGSSRRIEIALADDQDEFGVDTVVTPFLKDLESAVQLIAPGCIDLDPSRLNNSLPPIFSVIVYDPLQHIQQNRLNGTPFQQRQYNNAHDTGSNNHQHQHQDQDQEQHDIDRQRHITASASATKWKDNQVYSSSSTKTVRDAVVLSNNIISKYPNGDQDTYPELRQVRHIVLDVSKYESQLQQQQHTHGSLYIPGDVVYLYPRNTLSAVDAFLHMMELPGDMTISIHRITQQGHTQTHDGDPGLEFPVPVVTLSEQDAARFNVRFPCTIADLVAAQWDILGTPRRTFFELLAPYASNPMEKEKLLYLASDEGASDLHQYVNRERRTLLMVLRDFQSARPGESPQPQRPQAQQVHHDHSLAQHQQHSSSSSSVSSSSSYSNLVAKRLQILLDIMPRLRPRAFSIASSPVKHKGQIHVCVAIVRYVTPLRRLRVGVCSAFLMQLNPHDIVPFAIAKGTFEFPPMTEQTHLQQPLLLIGPGTGIAPFRSFLHSLPQYIVHSAPVYLFCGNRNKAYDFLYEEEWIYLVQTGVIDRLFTAFSRDPESGSALQERENQNNTTITATTTSTTTSSNPAPLSRTKYVQDYILAHSEAIYNLFVEDCRIFIAGSSNNMPRDVRQAFASVLVKEGALSETEADRFLAKMEATGKYQVESWS